MSECIFEQYDEFINDNRDLFSTPRDVTNFITDPVKRGSLYESLLSGIDDQSVRKNMQSIFEAETSTILSEGANFTLAN
jgi:hypothetical protein